MHPYSFTLVITFFSRPAFACITCNREIQEGIWNSRFYPNLVTMLSAFIVLAIIVGILSVLATKKHKSALAAQPGASLLSPVPLTTASMVLGIGLGGFLDGIVLHQVLQWHEMLSNRVPATDFAGKSINMFWDGVFHLFCLGVVVTGVVLFWKLLWRADINRSGKLLAGGLLSGWNLFNIVEGIIDHHLLQLHYVFQNAKNPDVGNYIFLGASVIMLIIGQSLIRSVPAHQMRRAT